MTVQFPKGVVLAILHISAINKRTNAIISKPLKLIEHSTFLNLHLKLYLVIRSRTKT